MGRLLAKHFLNRVVKHLKKQTDPSIIKKIIEDLKFDSFTIRDEGLKSFLRKLTEESVDLSKLIQSVETGLLNNAPLCKLFAFIEHEQLISDHELEILSKQLQIQLNLLCLFEACSVTMVNSFTFNEDVYCFTKKQRSTSYPGNPLFNLFFASNRYNFSLFKNLKLVSVDPVMTSGAFTRLLGNEELDQAAIQERSKEFINKHGLALWNTKISPTPIGEKHCDSVKNVSLNILEAIWEEKPGEDGQPNDNSFAGSALIRLLEHTQPSNGFSFMKLVLPVGSTIIADNKYSLLPDLIVNKLPKRVSQFLISTEWMYLYQSWNLLFVMQNLDSKFLPIKLLVPSVLNAIPEQYMETRVFMLYLIGNLYHYNKLSAFTEEIQLTHGQLILKKWGEINKKYADILLKTFCADLEESPEEIYHDIFGEHTHFSLAYYITHFIQDFASFRITRDESRACNLEIG
ncbi:hypothetical protein [Legionella parisiensis]|uniref:Symporter n=1 Tax=Legionella parisiensis TaxID=45071 RepID=A0A1E5JV84_9GAMM|nr:hypothetical protein [Legionella parisiensis]KTD42114.1 symporter [Legionella parisiensis]OEH48283.1 hypothetical protein lpari_00724 [Legionella parisiensis]STX75336.1 symporter [Legionella parisiensis]